MTADDVKRELEDAWVGDAVLALFARDFVLRKRGRIDADAFARLVSNDFLGAFGRPAAVEAQIGRHWREHGLDKTFAWLEATLLPLHERQEANRLKRPLRTRQRR